MVIEIKPYQLINLKNEIIDLQNFDTWKIQLTLFPQKDAEEERVMHSRSNNIKFTSYNEANEVVDELFESLHSTYQGNLETSIRGSDFIFDSMQLMYYKFHKVNFRFDGSYIDSPDFSKEKSNSKSKNQKMKMINVLNMQ